MPLAAEAEDFDHNSKPEVIEATLLPPVDVHWVWHCHCLSPVSSDPLIDDCGANV